MKFNYYKITNIKNNKIYIGITEKETFERIKQHFSKLKNNCHNNYKLQKDWNIYGENAFTWETLETLKFNSPEDGYYHEFELIQKNDTVNSGYNILQGGELNPMYTKSVKEKMIATKQSQVPNVYQLEEIEENTFKIVKSYPSQKSIQKETDWSQGNIQKAIKNHHMAYGYFWITENELNSFESEWRPKRVKISPTAQLDDNGQIVKVHHNMVDFCREYGWKHDAIRSAINRNGKAKGIKFIRISEEEYYKIKPITLIK